MRTFTIVILGLGLALAAFFGGMQWSGRRGADTAQGVMPAALDETAPATTDASGVSSENQTPPASAGNSTTEPAALTAWPELPPPGAPVAETFDELADRARRGDSGAACRLGLDLQVCARALARGELADDLQSEAARYERAPPDRMVNVIAVLEHEHEMNRNRCGGLQPEQLTQAYEFQRLAALARPELRNWFVLDPALDRRDFVNDLERWADYRQQAMPMLEAAAREGDFAALITLARVHGDLRRNSPPLPPFRIADDVRAVAYTELLRRYGVEFRGLDLGEERARARLDAGAQARASALADSLFRRDIARADDTAAGVAMRRTFSPSPKPDDCAR